MSIGLSLSDSQRRMIQSMKRKTRSRVEAMRCRIILLLDDGEAVSRLSAMVDCVRSTVYTTLYRFEDEGMDGLLDKRRDPGPRKATALVRETLLGYLDHNSSNLRLATQYVDTRTARSAVAGRYRRPPLGGALAHRAAPRAMPPRPASARLANPDAGAA